jgi:tripartite-type tricarboxylate transporter receptor subunit TctC
MSLETIGVRFCCLLAVLVLLLSGCAPADDAKLDNATITIVIPYRPGGGFDRTVRAFAPYFARQLGAGATVLPENVPGAGGRRGATKVYRARPDGTTLGIFNMPGFVLPEVLGEKVDYDLRKLSWIGRLESQDYVLLISATSELQDLDDVRAAADISFLSTGYGSSVLAASQIIAERLELADESPIYLAGYAGTADYLVGLIRGDGNVAVGPVSTSIKYIQSGDLRALAVTGDGSSLPGVPTFTELGLADLDALDLQRSIAGPPDIDADLLVTLREAFMRAVADPEFIATARNARLDLSPLAGDATADEVEQSFRFYETFKTNLKNPNAL